MFKTSFQNYLNHSVLKHAAKLRYTVADRAPNDEKSLFERSKSQGLVIWSGASDNTIFKDNAVNWAFRAFHDHSHLTTGLGFSPNDEIKLGNLKLVNCKYLQEILRLEVSEQARYYLNNNIFVDDQVQFMREHLKHNELFKSVMA